VILHQAAIPSVPRSISDPIESHLHGSHLAVLLLESARKAGVRRFIQAGSAAAYGESQVLPKREAMYPDPVSPYAATKIAAEFYAAAYAHSYGMETITLRYFNIFGPRQDPSSPYSGVIARFCQAFCRKEPVTIFGDGEQSRDFTFVENVAEANKKAALASGVFKGVVLNIGCGAATTLNGLVSELNGLTGRDVKPMYRDMREGDVRASLADISDAERQIGYSPTVPFAEGLKRTYEWYQSEEASLKGRVSTGS